MSWWGKIAGGAFGFMAGGPLGAALGIAAGSLFDSSIQGVADGSGNTQEKQIAYYTAAFSLLGAISKADGRVSADEIATARGMMDEMNFDPPMREVAINLFNAGRDFSKAEIDAAVAQFKQITGRSRYLHMALLRVLVRGALADQQWHPAEQAILTEVALGLGLPRSTIEQIALLFGHSTAGGQRQSSTSPGLDLNAAAKILGVEVSDSQDAVKKAYRRLMSQNHPDKLVAKGVPEEMVKAATAKTAVITEAYDTYKSGRGWV